MAKINTLLLLISVWMITGSIEGYSTTANMSPTSSIKYDKKWEDDPILPPDTIPTTYDLFLHPDLENGTFTGTIEIKVNVTKTRNYLLLHSDELDITKTDVYNENGSKIIVDNAFYYEKNQFWVIMLNDSLVPGKYDLKLEFNGSLTDKIIGFYKSTYTATDGRKRNLVTTKFEPTYARKAFPCFDEPRYKAEFTIRISRPSGDNYIALSNMKQVTEEPDTPSAGFTKVNFAPTPPMSTYLACFIVCDFEHLDPVYTSQGIPITVYARPGQQNKTEYARDLAKKATDYFVNYFNIDYPLPKIDLISIPDFVSGAMENWGLITFRESGLLVTPTDSISSKQDVANKVVHELAHMWFGDLVTMEWWDDLWLNEGFATFLAHKVIDIIEKGLHSNSEFVYGSLHRVLEEDAAESSHPIIQPVNHPDQITEIFDVISYNKGSAVLRMFEEYSPKSFQKAVQKYLKKYKFKNAVTDNLWSEIVDEYGIPNMTRMLNTWTKQKGYPLITAIRKDDKLVLSQNRFLSEYSNTYDSSDSLYGYKWDVPITYITSKHPSEPKSVIFKLEDNVVFIELDEGTEWIKLNPGQYGFYRVNYTDCEWVDMTSLLSYKAIAPIDRANLIDDAFVLAKGGYIKYNIPFQLVTYLKVTEEKDFEPWIVVSKHMYRYKNLLHGTPAYDKLLKFCSSIIAKQDLDGIWEKTESNNSLETYKETLLSFSCRMEAPQVIAKANDIFMDWIQGKTSKPDPNIRILVYKYGVRGSNETANRKRLWDLYLNETDPIEKRNLIVAIASVTNPEIMAELLELMKNEDNVRSQDYFIFILYMCQTPEGGEFVWNYLRKNWDYYVKRFTLNHRSFGLMLPKAVFYFSSEEKLKEVEEFIAKHPEAGAGAAGRKKAIETIQNNIKWRQLYYKGIEATLQSIEGMLDP